MGLRTRLGLKKRPALGAGKLSFRTANAWLPTPMRKRVSGGWYRGESTNFYPIKKLLRSADGAVRYIIAGWEPTQPLISRSTAVTVFGSCFAEHIANWLHERQYSISTKQAGGRSYLIDHGDGFVNSNSVRTQFEWALEKRLPPGAFWYGHDAKAFHYDEAVRLETEAIIRSTDMFIITLGLSELWYDEPTGEPFWHAVPISVYDPARHRFRVLTAAENAQNIRAVCDLIRRHVPDAKVILTLSPIPLAATFRPASAVTANAASKASLRAAIDEVMLEQQTPDFLHYWPSYEIVKEFFYDPFEEDGRHVKRPILDYIMTLFECVWCADAPKHDELLTRLRCSLRADRGLLYGLFRFRPLWLK